MVVVIDVDYREKSRQGHAAGVIAESILAEKETGVAAATVEEIEDYVPGQFYRRELKCVDAVLRQLPLEDLELIVVDGYADSGSTEKALGAWVYEKYGVPVIGVAKNKYKKCLVANTEVLRGGSSKPLHVTAMGIAHETAKDFVAKMSGQFRLPDLIKLADKCARDWTLSGKLEAP